MGTDTEAMAEWDPSDGADMAGMEGMELMITDMGVAMESPGVLVDSGEEGDLDNYYFSTGSNKF